MIPQWPTTLAAFAVACVGFTALGLPLARAVAPRNVPPVSLAPCLGWAVTTVLALPVLAVFGFSAISVWLFLAVAAGLALVFRGPIGASTLPLWAFAPAALMGLLPLMAIMPKFQGGLLLGPPMFDHVKIAVVDSILREGLPVPNPFFGQGRGVFAYYYLWHFSAAMLARLLGLDGWTAEAAMTGFTGFASVALMLGLTASLGGRVMAMALTALLSLPGSLRPVLAVLAGELGTNPFIPRKSDIGGWLNQSAWVPQHLASACCVVLSALLMLRLAENGSLFVAVLLGLCVAAGFESSTWVGGIAFAFAGSLLGVWLVCRLPPQARKNFLLRGGPAGLVAAALITPFVLTQLHMLAARHLGPPLAFAPYPTLGRLIPETWRTLLDIPAFWLVLLPFQFPALVPFAASATSPRVLQLPEKTRCLAATLILLAVSSLTVSWLLRSTIDNNDLGWRSVLPALMVLPAFAARAGEILARSKPVVFVLCALIAALGVPQTATMLQEYAAGVRPGAPQDFAAAAPLWPAIRRHTDPTDRIATNPLLARTATFWPVNIGWALFADRASCYAGRESVIAYGNLSRSQLDRIDARFGRVFAGHASADDLFAMSRDDDCDVIAVTPADGAWESGFGPGYEMVEQSGSWKVYRRVK